MDHRWAKEKLESFARACKDAISSHGSISAYEMYEDRAMELEPVAQKIMNTYQPGLGDYTVNNQSAASRWGQPRECALRAVGLASNYDDLRVKLKPDAPYLAADGMHNWVWTAAQPMWQADAYQEAVLAAVRVINARIQQRTGRHDISEYDLVMQVFDVSEPQPGKPRLRLPGDRTKPSWRSRQEGIKFFAAGYFRAIRNPAAHEESVAWSEQEALEYLAALSALARWVEVCELESHKH